MEKLFRKQLDFNDKVRSSRAVDNDEELKLLEARQRDKQSIVPPPERRRLVHNLMSSPINTADRATRVGDRISNSSNNLGKSLRTQPARSTRNSRAVHDHDVVEEVAPVKKEKIPYSEQFGLGKPWDK